MVKCSAVTCVNKCSQLYWICAKTDWTVIHRITWQQWCRQPGLVNKRTVRGCRGDGRTENIASQSACRCESVSPIFCVRGNSVCYITFPFTTVHIYNWSHKFSSTVVFLSPVRFGQTMWVPEEKNCKCNCCVISLFLGLLQQLFVQTPASPEHWCKNCHSKIEARSHHFCSLCALQLGIIMYAYFTCVCV